MISFNPCIYTQPIPTHSHTEFLLSYHNLISSSSYTQRIRLIVVNITITITFTFTVPLLVMDGKRKTSKKDTGSSSQGSSSTRSLFSRSSSTSNSPLLRSLSQKNSSSSSKCNNNLPRSFSQKNPSIGRKCTNIAKEQKARFYIMRRCVAMLVCWHKHGDSWRKTTQQKCTDLVLSSHGSNLHNFFISDPRDPFLALLNTIDSIVITS